MLGTIKRLHNQVTKSILLPFGYWSTLQRTLERVFQGAKNVLRNPAPESYFKNEALSHELRDLIILSADNQYTLDAITINKIWKDIHRIQPKTILEFGSGTSTRLFAKYLHSRDTKGTLISIDQSIAYLDTASEGLDGFEFNHLKLDFEVNDDGYQFDHKLFDTLKSVGGIDLILVDGPLGGHLVRKNTLPTVVNYCNNGCAWYLDDAFRDGEMNVLRIWKGMNHISVKGIANIGKGLAIGKVEK